MKNFISQHIHKVFIATIFILFYKVFTNHKLYIQDMGLIFSEPITYIAFLLSIVFLGIHQESPFYYEKIKAKLGESK